MRKIPPNLENPIDNYLLDVCEYVSPTFYNYGFTPNMITTLSNITTVIVILLLLHKFNDCKLIKLTIKNLYLNFLFVNDEGDK